MISFEVNNQTRFKVPTFALKKLLKLIAKKLKVKGSEIVSLAFVTPSIIKRLNKVYRGKNKITDVLSFEDDAGSRGNREKGEIIICPSRARQQAKEFGITFEQEIIKLFLHGYLHLSRYDHEKKSDAEIMESLEAEILKLYYDTN